MDHPYESLTYMARLEFKDAHGIDARFHCYQRLRILVPELSFVAHRIWGAGDQMNDYAAPGTHVVRHVREDGRELVVSALDTPAKRGDIIELHSIRRIHHGFKGEHESWEYIPFTPTERARVSISFPIAKDPEAITVSSSPGSASPFVGRPATRDLTVAVSSPITGSLYRIEWSW